MNSDEQVGDGSNGDLSQQREGSREDLPMFNHGRLQSHEQDESSMFVDQDHGSRTLSPEAQSDNEEEDSIHGDHQQAGADQGSHEFDSPEGSSGADEDELLNDEDMAKEGEWRDPVDEPDDGPNQAQPSLGCGPCKILHKRLERREKVLEDKCNIIKAKSLRLSVSQGKIRTLREKIKDNAQVKALVKKIKALEVKLDENEEKIRRLKVILRLNGIDPEDGKRFRSVPNPNTSHRATPDAWKGDLREFYQTLRRNHNVIDMGAWEKVWKAQYKQGNIPVNPGLLHPDIRLKYPEDLQDDDSVASGDSDTPRAGTTFIPRPIQADFEGFNKLPATILLNILSKALFFSGRVVHIFSRLDPYKPPANFRTAKRLPGRIYISNGKRAYISLTRDTIDPNKLLSPLRVNRKWNYFGAHVFYGKNTFAFSSFGEFGRFCNGIGDARLQRIAHLELHWQGGSCVRFAEADKGYDPRKSQSYRSMPLARLMDMKRLDTLVIHIDESRTRRPLEASYHIQFALEATVQQPNYRLKRTARMRNTPEKAAVCRLESLLPFFPDLEGKWSPGDDDHRLVLGILDQPHLEDNDLDRDYSSESESASDSSSSDSSRDEDIEDEDEDGNEDGPQRQTAAGGGSATYKSANPDLPSGERREGDVIVIDDDDDAETEEERGVTHMSAPPDLPSRERAVEVSTIDDDQSLETAEGRVVMTHMSAPPELPSGKTEEEVNIIEDDQHSETGNERGFLTHMSAPPDLPSRQREGVIVIDDNEASETEEGRELVTHMSAPPELPSGDRGDAIIVIDDNSDSDTEEERVFVTRMNAHTELASQEKEREVIYIDDDDDSENESEGAESLRERSQNRRSTTSGLFVSPGPGEEQSQNRRSTTSRLSSSLFVSPEPGEEQSQYRRSTTSRLSSSLFVTPGPGEEQSTASTTASPDPTDVNKSVGNKRSASYDAVETKRRKTETQI
ncbi:hypothetical protein N0V82_000455 [Gnomoniopsis sp. IMI 355080]|nr:hypothetical protein N0V82_000455 [Gnomoniopsis sp. IMI 355080]